MNCLDFHNLIAVILFAYMHTFMAWTFLMGFLGSSLLSTWGAVPSWREREHVWAIWNWRGHVDVTRIDSEKKWVDPEWSTASFQIQFRLSPARGPCTGTVFVSNLHHLISPEYSNDWYDYDVIRLRPSRSSRTSWYAFFERLKLARLNIWSLAVIFGLIVFFAIIEVRPSLLSWDHIPKASLRAPSQHGSRPDMGYTIISPQPPSETGPTSWLSCLGGLSSSARYILSSFSILPLPVLLSLVWDLTDSCEFFWPAESGKLWLFVQPLYYVDILDGRRS